MCISGNIPRKKTGGLVMAQKSSQQSPSQPQWSPTPIEIRLQLSSNFLKSKSPFIALISNGYQFPKCTFVISDRREHCTSVRVQFDRENHFSLLTSSPLSKVSLACTDLNLAIASSCEIHANIHEREVIFTITAPSKAKEDHLNKMVAFTHGEI